MRTLLLLLAIGISVVGCDQSDPPTGPTVVINTTVVSTSGGGPGSGPMNPQPGTGGGTSGPRAPDPTSGFLPLPAYGEGIASQVAQSPTGMSLLAQSCYQTFGAASWGYLEAIVDRLRQVDTRWGYSCYQGVCAVPANDAIAYHATTGPDVTGAIGTWTVVVIANNCASPTATWRPIYEPFGVWTTRGR